MYVVRNAVGHYRKGNCKIVHALFDCSMLLPHGQGLSMRYNRTYCAELHQGNARADQKARPYSSWIVKQKPLNTIVRSWRFWRSWRSGTALVNEKINPFCNFELALPHSSTANVLPCDLNFQRTIETNFIYLPHSIKHLKSESIPIRNNNRSAAIPFSIFTCAVRYTTVVVFVRVLKTTCEIHRPP